MVNDAPLPMTEAEWAVRLRRSREALKSWRHEARLPWADNELMIAVVETEIDALEHYLPHMPVRLRPAVGPLVHDWDEFRLTLVER